MTQNLFITQSQYLDKMFQKIIKKITYLIFDKRPKKLSFNALYIHINISRNLNNLDTYHKLINKLEENGIENCFDSPNTLYVNNYI